MVHSETEAQREDLITLLALTSDPRTAAMDLKTSERKWLRDAAARLALDDEGLADRFTDEALRAAQAAQEILTSS